MLKSIVAAAALTTLAHAQPTAFTYQGRLKNGAAPAAGLHDFRFRLWDAVSGGVQLGSTQCVDNLLITDGLFTATIDFGQQFATPNQRFLEIEVRADTGLDCTNAAGFVVLAPRQPLSAAPLANHAKSAFSLDAADGSPAGAVIVDGSGKVGIGTPAPTHTVHIASTDPTLALQDTDSTTQQVGFVSYRDSANVERAWVGYGSAGDPNFSVVNARTGGDIILLPFAGNVGIGTSSPVSTLHVAGSGRFDGDVRLGPSGQFFAPAASENLRIIRGSVSEAGTIRAGTSFGIGHDGTGQFTITFATPFASTPVFVVSANPSLAIAKSYVYSHTVQPGSAHVTTLDALLDPGDRGFDFIAIGPR